MDLECHITDQKGQKMYRKGQKMEFSDLKYLFFCGIGGYPPPPLNGKSSCSKTHSGNGGYHLPPPLTENIRSVVFDRFPKSFCS